MKRAFAIFSALMLSFTVLSRGQESDVFVPIGKYIQLGDHESLAVWFANNLELDILGNINDCSKIQATQIIKDFFITYANEVCNRETQRRRRKFQSHPFRQDPARRQSDPTAQDRARFPSVAPAVIFRI